MASEPSAVTCYHPSEFLMAVATHPMSGFSIHCFMQQRILSQPPAAQLRAVRPALV